MNFWQNLVHYYERSPAAQFVRIADKPESVQCTHERIGKLMYQWGTGRCVLLTVG